MVFEFVSRKIPMKKFLQNNIWLLALSLPVISALYLSGCSNNGLVAAKGMYGAGLGPGPVNLGAAGNYVILAKTGVSTVPASNVTGNIGVSPVSDTALTGWSQTNDSSNVFSTSAQVTGKLYAANYADP